MIDTDNTTVALIEGMSFEDYKSVVQVLLAELETQTKKHVRFELGDAMIFGKRTYGEMYNQWMEATGRKPSDLRSMVSVASRVPAVNRLTGLSWSHHAAVANLPPQAQRTWLIRAEQQRWSKDKLRKQLITARVIRVERTECPMCGFSRFAGETCIRCDQIKEGRKFDPGSTLVLLRSNADDAAEEMLDRHHRGFTNEWLRRYVRRLQIRLDRRKNGREVEVADVVAVDDSAPVDDTTISTTPNNITEVVQ